MKTKLAFSGRRQISPLPWTSWLRWQISITRGNVPQMSRDVVRGSGQFGDYPVWTSNDHTPST